MQLQHCYSFTEMFEEVPDVGAFKLVEILGLNPETSHVGAGEKQKDFQVRSVALFRNDFPPINGESPHVRKHKKALFPRLVPFLLSNIMVYLFHLEKVEGELCEEAALRARAQHFGHR